MVPYRDASTDPATVRRWFARWPDANLGWYPGADGCLVIDAAGREGVAAFLDLASGLD